MRAARAATPHLSGPVVARRPQLQVLGAVVSFVAVDVMDRFVRLQPTSELLPHDNAVLSKAALIFKARRALIRWKVKRHVAMAVQLTLWGRRTPALPAPALTRTELTLRGITWQHFELASALGASEGHALNPALSTSATLGCVPTVGTAIKRPAALLCASELERGALSRLPALGAGNLNGFLLDP